MKACILFFLLIASSNLYTQQLWQSLGTELYCSSGGCSNIQDVITWKEEIYTAGDFNLFDGLTNVAGPNLIKWDGVRWNAVGDAVFDNGSINAIIYDIFATNESLFVVGAFTSLNGNTDFNNIARWDGCDWFPVGQGINNGKIYSIYAHDENNLYVGGNFNNAGGNLSADKIAHWNGSNWNELNGGGSNKISNTIRVLTFWNGYLYAGGNLTCRSLPNQNNSTFTFRNIAKWNGSHWYPMVNNEYCNIAGSYLHDLKVINNELYMIGSLSNGCYPNRYDQDIIRYDGVNLNDVGINGNFNGLVYCIYEFNNEIYIGGDFTGDDNGVVFNNFSRLNANTWSSFGTNLNNSVRGITELNNIMHIGGAFSNVDGSTFKDNFVKWDNSLDLSCGNDPDILAIDSMLSLGNQGIFYGSRDDYHFYELEKTICNIDSSNCTIENVWNYYKSDLYFQLPRSTDFLTNSFDNEFDHNSFLSGQPIQDCTQYNLSVAHWMTKIRNSEMVLANLPPCIDSFDITSLDPVGIVIDEENHQITNYTLKGHILYPGKVQRYLKKDDCGNIILKTIGSGFHLCGDNIVGKAMSTSNFAMGSLAFKRISDRFHFHYHLNN